MPLKIKTLIDVEKNQTKTDIKTASVIKKNKSLHIQNASKIKTQIMSIRPKQKQTSGQHQ